MCNDSVGASAARRRADLERERLRIEQAVRRGTLTRAQAAAQLGRLRERLIELRCGQPYAGETRQESRLK